MEQAILAVRLVLEELLLDSMVLHPMQARLLATCYEVRDDKVAPLAAQSAAGCCAEDAYTAGITWQIKIFKIAK